MKFEYFNQAFRLQLSPILEAEEAIVRELEDTQQLRDWLNTLLGLCLLHYQLIVTWIDEWLLELIVHSLRALMEFLTSMADTALARVEKISLAKLALLNATTPEEREKVLNAVHRLAQRSEECRTLLLQEIIRVAGDLLMRIRIALP
jgi:hypothetical protein